MLRVMQWGEGGAWGEAVVNQNCNYVIEMLSELIGFLIRCIRNFSNEFGHILVTVSNKMFFFFLNVLAFIGKSPSDAVMRSVLWKHKSDGKLWGFLRLETRWRALRCCCDVTAVPAWPTVWVYGGRGTWLFHWPSYVTQHYTALAAEGGWGRLREAPCAVTCAQWRPACTLQTLGMWRATRSLLFTRNAGLCEACVFLFDCLFVFLAVRLKKS